GYPRVLPPTRRGVLSGRSGRRRVATVGPLHGDHARAALRGALCQRRPELRAPGGWLRRACGAVPLLPGRRRRRLSDRDRVHTRERAATMPSIARPSITLLAAFWVAAVPRAARSTDRCVAEIGRQLARLAAVDVRDALHGTSPAASIDGRRLRRAC